MLLEEKKVNFRGFRVFNFALYPKPETRTFRKVFFLLKILTAVVTFSKFVFSRERERERVKPCFLWLLIWSYFFLKISLKFLKLVRGFGDFLFNTNIFISFVGFLTFPCYKEINDMNVNQMLAFFYFEPTLKEKRNSYFCVTPKNQALHECTLLFFK